LRIYSLSFLTQLLYGEEAEERRLGSDSINAAAGAERGQWRLRGRRHWRLASAAAANSPPYCGELVVIT
jgi:hypothetical protein